MKAVTAATVAGLLLAACNQGPGERFYKKGATADDYSRDTYECERETRQVAASFGVGPAARSYAFDFMFKCMVARGYSYGRFMDY